jgi:hypothetical protein
MKKDLYSIRERDTNPFYEKDPGDYTNYKEDHPMSREQLSLTAAPERRTCQSQRAAPSFGFAARVDAMRPPCHT